MKQERIKTINGAVNTAQLIIAGIAEVSAGVALPHNPVADINTDLTNMIMARGNHEQAKQVKAARRNALLDAINEGQKFVRATRDVFKMNWGNTYTELFTTLGFQGNFEVTDSVEDLIGMLLSIKLQLTANPTQEVGTLITAARAQALIEALQAAEAAVVSQDAEIKSMIVIRDAKFDTLCKRISNVYQELRMQLDPLDTRWLKFGFNMPGADETPEMPTGLLATLIGPTAVALKWEAAERAAYYRIYKKVTGVDQDYVAVGSPADLDFTIENLPAGSTVEIQITAVNTGGESSRTEAVTVIMHS